MRLWSIHPRYLDTKALVALWREGLLAQAVLLGRTKGYVNHPQLHRFRVRHDPAAWIAAYLHGIHVESVARGYRFDEGRIASRSPRLAGEIEVAFGQLRFEVRHLADKVAARAPEWHRAVVAPLSPGLEVDPHPIFSVVPGGVEDWEKGPGRSGSAGVARGTESPTPRRGRPANEADGG